MSKKVGVYGRRRVREKRRIRPVLDLGVSEYPHRRLKAAERVPRWGITTEGKQLGKKLALGRGGLSRARFFPLFVPDQLVCRLPAGAGRKPRSKTNDTTLDYIVA